MLTTPTEIKAWIEERCYASPFVKACNIEVESIECGKVVLSMQITKETTNVYGIAHGGALFTLMDTSMGVTCLGMGKNVVTIDMTTNFLKGATLGTKVYSIPRVLHNGSRSIILETELQDKDHNLLAKATATFCILALNDRVPTKW